MVKKRVVEVENNSIKILNAIYNESPLDYQNRVPQATQDNLKQVGEAIMSNTALQNQFLSSLVNRIGLTMITSKMYSNPLKKFKKGKLEFGEVVQEVFVRLTKAENWDYNDVRNPFKRNNPDVESHYHSVNNEKIYTTTVSPVMLEGAFLSSTGVYDLVSKIVEALYTSFEYDEFTETKLMLSELLEKGFIRKIEIPSMTENNSKEIAKKIKEVSNKMRFMRTDYNKNGVENFTPVERQYLIYTTEFNAMFDIDVLANAFNIEKADFLGNQLMVDDFLKARDVKAMIVDEDFFMIFDKNIMMTEQFNPANHYWNYFLTTRQIFSASPFANAVAFYVDDGNEIKDMGEPILNKEDQVFEDALNGTISKSFLDNYDDGEGPRFPIYLKSSLNKYYAEDGNKYVYGVIIKNQNGSEIVRTLQSDANINESTDKYTVRVSTNFLNDNQTASSIEITPVFRQNETEVYGTPVEFDVVE